MGEGILKTLTVFSKRKNELGSGEREYLRKSVFSSLGEKGSGGEDTEEHPSLFIKFRGWGVIGQGT